MKNIPVFPVLQESYDFETPSGKGREYRSMNGLTLRDYFAACALANLAEMNGYSESIANKAYDIADAMMERAGK